MSKETPRETLAQRVTLNVMTVVLAIAAGLSAAHFFPLS